MIFNENFRNYINEKEPEEFHEKARVLTYTIEDYATLEDIKTWKAPRQIRYLRIFYSPHSNFALLASKFPYLHTIDLNYVEICSTTLSKLNKYKLINYGVSIDLSITKNNLDGDWIKQNGISDPKDLDLYRTYLSNFNEMYWLYSVKLEYINWPKVYRDYRFVVTARGIDGLSVLLPFAKHLDLNVSAKQLLELPDLLAGLTIKSLRIRFTVREIDIQKIITDQDLHDLHADSYRIVGKVVKRLKNKLNKTAVIEELFIDWHCR